MLPGPIFNVELLTSARRTRYFIVRTVYAIVLLGVLWLIYYQWTQMRRWTNAPIDIHAMAQLSAMFFGTFAWIQMLAVVAIAPAMTAGAIANERERHTIEYLFASRLGNAEIVLGKLAARMVHVAYLILTGVPILALMMLLGGIAPEALLVLYILTLSTMLTVCSLGMAISVWSDRAREAVTRAYLLLFALLVVPPLARGACIAIAQTYPMPFVDAYVVPVIDQFLVANPFLVMTDILSRASGTQWGMALDVVGAMVRNQMIFACVMVAASTLLVRRVHLRRRVASPRRRRRLMQWLRPSVGDRPMLWKEIFAEPAASRLGWTGRITLAVIVVAVVVPTFYTFFTAQATAGPNLRQASNFYEYLRYAMTIGTLLACGGLLLVAARAAGSIASEKERDCWTSLLCTPLEPGEIVWAKIAGNIWSLRGLVLLLLLIWGLGVVLDAAFLVPMVFLTGTFLILAVYASALGVRFSLWCRSSLHAMGATLAVGLFFGGFYLLCCVPVMIASSGGDGAMLMLAPCVPYLMMAPGFFYVSSDHISREGGIMVFAYLLGTVGYSLAALALAGWSIASFDRLNGRIVWAPSARRMPTPDIAKPPDVAAASPFAAGHIIAEAVDSPGRLRQ